MEREDVRDELSRGVNFPGRLTRSVGLRSQVKVGAGGRNRPAAALRERCCSVNVAAKNAFKLMANAKMLMEELSS